MLVNGSVPAAARVRPAVRLLRAQRAAAEGAGGGLIGPYRLPALIVGALTMLGLAIRLQVAGESVFADELATYWIVSAHDLPGVVSVVHTDAEITPPLSFLLSWLTTRIDLTPELLRAPALLAGTAAIPITYLLGLRTVGRGAALVAAALTALAPFMIYYSAEARGYGVAIVLVMLSTLAMLAALDGGRVRWWVAYGACSCAAVYTHYTTVFPLAVQVAWLFWTHRAAWRAALLANAAAVACFLPWLSGLVNDFQSPTALILDRLSPFNANTARITFEHWSIGYPYSVVPLRDLPGDAALALLVLGVGVAVGGLVFARRRERPGRLARSDRRLWLIAGLALSAPVGEALVSAVGTNLFGVRNLAVSWPGFALTLAALLMAAGPRLRFATAALLIASFAIGAVKMLEPRFQRPDYHGAAAFIQREASAGDVVVDGAVISPGPVGGIDVPLGRSLRVLRVGAPQQRDHPFSVFDPMLPVADVARRAVAVAAGRRIFVLSMNTPDRDDELARARLLPGYRRVGESSYPGIVSLDVGVYARLASPPG